MAATITVVEAAQILSELAGSAWATAQLVNLIQQHAQAHPEHVSALAPEHQAQVQSWLDQQDQLERESGA